MDKGMKEPPFCCTSLMWTLISTIYPEIQDSVSSQTLYPIILKKAGVSLYLLSVILANGYRIHLGMVKGTFAICT